MKKELIVQLKKSFEESAYEEQDIEYWLARDLQKLLDYEEWRNFVNVIEKAKISCKNAGQNISDHFVDINKTIQMPKGATKEIDDIMLTRYACYIIAQNGDSRKEQIAFGRIRSKGDQALFGGYTTLQMKHKLGLPKNRPLADFLPTITITAKNLAAEITNFNVKKNNLFGESTITKEHINNNKDVRELLAKSGIAPENLPPEQDIKKLERKVKSDEKLLSATAKKLPVKR